MTHNELVKKARKQLDHLGLTPYQLHQNLNRSVSKQTIYNFFKHGRVIRSDILLRILNELHVGISFAHNSSTRYER